jgi:hypothetical protein
MLDLDSHSVFTNGAYLLPALPAALLGPLVGGVVTGAALWLAWGSGRYHTTYGRKAQGEDVAAMLTYLSALFAAVLSPWSAWALLLPVAAAPLHERYVWAIDSQVAAPLWIAASLLALALQIGLFPAALPGAFALAGGAIKLSQPGPRSRLHSLWHVCGGLSAASALFALYLYT